MKRIFTLVALSAFYINMASAQDAEVKLSDNYTELKASVVALKNDNPRFIPHALFCNEDYIVIAQSHSSPYFYIYDYDGNLKTAQFSAGRGPQDLLNPDLRFFSPTKDGFRILEQGNTICDVVYNGASMSIVKKERLQIEFTANNLLDLGYGQFCSVMGLHPNPKMADYELCITNTTSKSENRYFGKYPKEYDFRDIGEKMFKCMSVGVNSGKQRRFAYFYRFMGRFRIYDYTTQLLKDVSIAGTKGAPISNSTYERTLYFRSATANDKYILTTYHNCKYKDAESAQTTMLLQWDWDGNLIAQYRLDRYIDRIAMSAENILVGLNSLDDRAQIYLFKIEM